MTCYCFLNGNVLPANEASVSITDLGLLRGYGIFDYLRTYYGIPFRLQDYLERFRASANDLRLPLKYSDSQITSIVDDLLKKSGITGDAGIRLLLTGGNSPDSMSIAEPNFAVIIEYLPPTPKEQYENGVKLITYPFKRVFPLSKTTNYIAAIKMQPEVKAQKAFDLLYVFNNEVLEVTRNNFFLIKGDSLITAKDGVLEGVTRKVILELTKEHFNLEVRKVHSNELNAADETFLSGSAKKIIPVVQVDEKIYGSGKPGAGTRKIMQLFDEYVEEVCGKKAIVG
ncbi:MAG TPA: aminotransferase class IV [Chitinophagales bacterium]|nr:aminotransferase class IV [Chitinophagales bacterium]